MLRQFDKSKLIGTGEKEKMCRYDKRLAPHTPQHPPKDNFATSTISKKSKVEKPIKPSQGLIKFQGKYLSDEVTSYAGNSLLIKKDIDSLWPQLSEEVKVEMTKRHPSQAEKYHSLEMALWKRFCYAFTRYYQNTAKACDHCKISRNHYYRSRNIYPSFDLILGIIEDRFVDEVEETTKKHSLLPNSIVERIFLLKTRRRDKYMDQPQLLSATKIEVNIPNISGMRGDTADSNISVGIPVKELTAEVVSKNEGVEDVKV